jgi:hypothetical protein
MDVILELMLVSIRQGNNQALKIKYVNKLSQLLHVKLDNFTSLVHGAFIDFKLIPSVLDGWN